MSGHVLDVLYAPYATLWRMYYMYLLERNWPSNCLITLGIRVCGRWKFHLPPTWLRCQPFLSLALSLSPPLSLSFSIVHLTNHVQTLSQVRLYLCLSPSPLDQHVLRFALWFMCSIGFSYHIISYIVITSGLEGCSELISELTSPGSWCCSLYPVESWPVLGYYWKPFDMLILHRVCGLTSDLYVSYSYMKELARLNIGILAVSLLFKLQMAYILGLSKIYL